jgi:hypothetical protein
LKFSSLAIAPTFAGKCNGTLQSQGRADRAPISGFPGARFYDTMILYRTVTTFVAGFRPLEA